MRKLALVVSHLLVAALGFAAGIYFLPILISPAPPSSVEVRAVAASAPYSGRFRRDLEDSDALHWGEGEVFVGPDAIVLEGRLAPGPDYQLYLAPEFVETEADFRRLKPRMARVGAVKTFTNFIVPIPPAIDPGAYDTVVIWCEAFGQFITAARYR